MHILPTRFHPPANPLQRSSQIHIEEPIWRPVQDVPVSGGHWRERESTAAPQAGTRPAVVLL
jgi:hypothetical protein